MRYTFLTGRVTSQELRYMEHVKKQGVALHKVGIALRKEGAALHEKKLHNSLPYLNIINIITCSNAR
jgi:hypothetical protein